MNHYSQNDEQEFILEFFKDKTGNLLDVGAYDGTTFSNSRALLELGWSGILVEPDPFNLCKLIKSKPPNSTIVCAAVGSVSTYTQLFIEESENRGWASTISKDNIETGRVLEMCGQPVLVSVINMMMLSLMGKFDFINIDAEWNDFEIIKSTPKGMLQHCKLMSIEPRGLEERALMKEWFSANTSFKVVHETPENLLLAP